ncbi:MAG: glutathione S-transferase family protein [Minwuia sp.]|uniref:glutathione S-transferase family protein n=1 Tax=Minwuia sp. TaxID=2493630 RepID=UPI003A8B5B8B
MLKVWGRTNSINVQKVMWTIAELGLPHEHTNVGGAFGGNDSAEYLAMNPNGRVPVIDDDGLVIWESNAIVRYLCAKHSEGALWQADPAARSHADRWMDWQASSLIADLVTVFWGLIRTPEPERDWIAIGDAATRLNNQMGILDAHLSQLPWVAGDRMTMGDIPIGALVYRWLHLPMERPEAHNIDAYYQRLTERPAFADHVMIPLT